MGIINKCTAGIMIYNSYYIVIGNCATIPNTHYFIMMGACFLCGIKFIFHVFLINS